jgi:hypothetical protein
MHQHDQQYRPPSLLFRILQASPSIKLEKYDVSILDGVVSTLLTVLPCCLESYIQQFLLTALLESS